MHMLFFNHDDNSLQWGPDQVMYMNELLETTDGGVCIELAPVFNRKSTDTTFVVSCCVAGMGKDEITATVEANVLVVTGESDARAAREGVSYSYWRFRKNILLPSEVQADSMVVYFHEGLLVVSFAK